jgi:hypothetical protein
VTSVNLPLIEVRLTKIGGDLIDVHSLIKAVIAAAQSPDDGPGCISKMEMSYVLGFAERQLSELRDAADETPLINAPASEDEQQRLQRLGRVRS